MKPQKPKEFFVPGAPPPPQPGEGSLGEALGGGIVGAVGGGCIGWVIGVVLVVLGGLACLTVIGAILGVPMILLGVSLPFFLGGAGGAAGVHSGAGKSSVFDWENKLSPQTRKIVLAVTALVVIGSLVAMAVGAW